MLEVIELVFPYFTIILIGFCAGRWRSLGHQALGWMNFFIVYVALPALFFRLIIETPIHEFTNGRYILITTLCTFGIYALSLIIGKITGRTSLKEATIQGFCGAYSNIGYMGIGMCLSVFGNEAIVPIALVFCFDNMMHFIVAPLLMSVASSNNQPFGQLLFVIMKRVLLHPFILATFAGLIAAALGLTFPTMINNTLDNLASTAAPSALFVLGITLALTKVKRWTSDMSWLLLIKMALHPLLMLLLLTFLGNFPPVWIGVAVLMASLPVALNVFVLAEQYQAYNAQASSIILISTVISVISLPFIIHLLKHGFMG